MELITVDFETAAIQPRPAYPPLAVGVAVRWPGRQARYWAWAHPTENNCTKQQAHQELEKVWQSKLPLLFHNSKFDLEVANHSFGLPLPPWQRIEDTLYLLFLDDAHAPSLSLKPAAARLLGLPAVEQDAVRNWLVEHGICQRNRADHGAYISQAPGNLVGQYAAGDVDRTLALHRLLHQRVCAQNDMQAPYDRERQLMPLLLRNEQVGIRVDWELLEKDAEQYRQTMDNVDHWLRRQLKTKELNIDSDKELATALENCGAISHWVMTPTGQRSVSKDNLRQEQFKQLALYQALTYRNRLATCIGTFIDPWLDVARKTNGRIHTSWNQVRQHSNAQHAIGTRTGRLSSSPNFQNIPKNFTADPAYQHPKKPINLLPLPQLRRYLLPDKKEVWIHADYNQQELRILAHFEDDKLLHAYQQNATLDIHEFVRQEIAHYSNQELPRRKVKNLNFGLIYGMGSGALAERLGCTVEQALQLRKAHLQALPGLRQLQQLLRQRAHLNLPLRTWGGRLYYCEKPRQTPDGALHTYEYKLLNYLIQGSAADCTKQALLNYEGLRQQGRLLVTVHDELNISVPRAAVRTERKLLEEAMCGVQFDLPMLVDIKTGENWAELKG